MTERKTTGCQHAIIANCASILSRHRIGIFKQIQINEHPARKTPNGHIAGILVLTLYKN